MVPFCAKQGVEKKISFEDFLSAMLSDYECAYACGLAARKLGMRVPKTMPLAELKQAVEEAIREAPPPRDYREKNLYQLIQGYALRGFEEVPGEIPVLIEMGLSGTYLD